MLVAVMGTLFFHPTEKQRALDAFLAAMALTLVVSYAIWLGILPIDEPPNRYPANPAAFKLHITHGVLMALAAFLAADRALRAGDRRWRMVYTAGAALAACNVFMLHGRTGHVVFVVLAVYFAAAGWRWRGVGAVAATLAVTFGIFHAVTTAEMRETRAQRNDTSTAIRLNYYRTTAAIVRDHPALGVGTGGFVSAYREKIKGTDLPESNNPHSQYLLTAAQLGAVGLVALLALFFILWRQARALEPAARLAARGLVLTMAVGCLFNSFLIDHVEGLLFAWMAGVLFAAPPPDK
jgi:O-antigen ligase